MKNLIFASISTLMIIAWVISPANSQDHSNHTNAESTQQFDDVPEEFRINLTQVVHAYLNGKDVFIKSDHEASVSGFESFKNELEKMGQHSLSGDGHMAWMQTYERLMDYASELNSSDQLVDALQAFRDLSHELAIAVKKFGVEGIVYHQYCPMAIDKDGATWLSKNEEIQNPYTPDTMLGCGELIERIES